MPCRLRAMDGRGQANRAFTELLIRANQLLLDVEKSEAQQVSSAGNAIVIASM